MSARDERESFADGTPTAADAFGRSPLCSRLHSAVSDGPAASRSLLTSEWVARRRGYPCIVSSNCGHVCRHRHMHLHSRLAHNPGQIHKGTDALWRPLVTSCRQAGQHGELLASQPHDNGDRPHIQGPVPHGVCFHAHLRAGCSALRRCARTTAQTHACRNMRTHSYSDLSDVTQLFARGSNPFFQRYPCQLICQVR